MYVFITRYENFDIEAMAIAYDIQNEKYSFLGIVFDYIER